MTRFFRTGMVGWLLATGTITPVLGQTPTGNQRVTVVPGESYGAGFLHRFLFGSDHRELWTTPIEVELLDLSTFAGGLTPLRRGGGMQTRSLRFGAADGREFQFRSVDKDPSAILPEELRETLVGGIVQDQISSAHPVGALAVAPILDAVGVLHADPILVLMPDDPRLGEFREEFAGVLGIIEERPDENDTDLAAFHGASNVVSTPAMLERLEEDLEVIDAPALLAARLTDLFLGDWDRHEDQWRWAKFGEGREDGWMPIPRDRDQAFVRYDGLLLLVGRQYYPRFVKFGSGYPDLLGLTWQARNLDRRLLASLPWSAWDSVTTTLQSQLTDDVIEVAASQLPPEYEPLEGADLRRRLAARRDGLSDLARAFYEALAEEVEVHSTDAPELAEVRGLSETELEVVVTARDPELGDVEVFRRRLYRSETKEVRLFMKGGADSVRVTGVRSRIGVRVVGGGARDTFIDEVGGAHFYDTGNQSVFVRGPGTVVDDRDYEAPPPSPSPLNRDWGNMYMFPLVASFSPDVGLLAGLSVERYDFGFRKVPWSSAAKLRAAWGTGANTFFFDGELQFYRENSRAHLLIRGKVSGLDILRFYGFGNETTATEPEPDYEVETRRYLVEPRVVLPLADDVGISFGPTLSYTDTDRPPVWLGDETAPYGMGSFGQLGFGAQVVADGRDRPRSATRGAVLTVEGTGYPATWDVTDAYGYVGGEAAAYLTPGAELQPTLAVRVGGRKMFGPTPYFDAAYIGNAETVRLGFDRRFAGDAMAHANAELRLKLGRAMIALPADIGVFGLYDVGRVWLDGESSDRWHDAVGGGLWFAFLKPENAFTVAFTRSDERTGLYIGAGFAF